ncbi:hypothetical protein COK00_20005 [Bacillus cereus]|uniref:Uncharacterized protein n=1 Tax=Bacillus cereus TaxID=1396 RepID=A0A2B4DCI0_BACCE|nr:hypothetical protein CON28_10430 [Bacillus cereus]PEX38460.1 hypothetical protein CN455_12775 [Bacillus cereus]PFB11731.1 hypothetical protein CN399_24065 [Bacillus cereus]PFC70497.1 hypothetical protein CN290_26445 [Bacillus cereus]PFM26609.1 hypothetical protein COJ47_29020 [Bacillus cereus]
MVNLQWKKKVFHKHKGRIHLVNIIIISGVLTNPFKIPFGSGSPVLSFLYLFDRKKQTIYNKKNYLKYNL